MQAADSCRKCGARYDPTAMAAAFDEAKLALAEAEVAVGCVFQDLETREIVSRGHNATNRCAHALAHAEFVAVEQLMKQNPPRADLSGLCLYVTIEPCVMCAAMLLYNRVSHVFFGAGNPRFGGTGTVVDVPSLSGLLQVGGNSVAYCSEGGRDAAEAISLLQSFYGHENGAAPAEKRRRKEPTAQL
jgi:tRNA-specific adenosine deaminase 2